MHALKYSNRTLMQQNFCCNVAHTAGLHNGIVLGFCTAQ